MSDLKQFFLMGGYAFYVWLAYGCVFFILGLNTVNILKSKPHKGRTDER